MTYLINSGLYLLPVIPRRKELQSVNSTISNTPHLMRHLICAVINNGRHRPHRLNCGESGSLNPLVPLLNSSIYA
jgi:hypothetical protein